MVRELVLVPVVVLAGCNDGGGKESGSADGGGGDTGFQVEECRTLQSEEMGAGLDINDSRKGCFKALSTSWVASSSVSPDDLWTWEYHADDSYTDFAADSVAEVFRDLRPDADESRLATAFLGATVLASTFDDAGSAWSYDQACSALAANASCGLYDYYPYATDCRKATKTWDVPPPPAGGDPEGFCDAVFHASGAPFNCTGSPFSNAVSFAASLSAAAGDSAYWLTLSPAQNENPVIGWWPVFLSAYVTDNPALVLYKIDPDELDGGQNPISGVMAVHEVGIEVKGASTEITRFDFWIRWLVTGQGSDPGAPDFDKLRIVMPSYLKYTPYVDLTAPPSSVVKEWRPGQEVFQDDATSTTGRFVQVTSIIDPCRLPLSEEQERIDGGDPWNPGDCQNRAEAWSTVSNAVTVDRIEDSDATACP